MTEVAGEEPAGDAAPAPAAHAPLRDNSELLFRQVHPDFFDQGQPTSGAFRPGSNDEGELSVDRSSLTTAEQAFVRHTVDQNLKSSGTWAVSVGEVTAAELKAIPDPVDDNAHAFVNFKGLGRGRRDAKSKLLRSAAVGRGCQFRPEPGSAREDEQDVVTM